ncbi:MAG: hypothetical protein M0015_08810, partial [Betaproteobacteria bacterium]|nr:hypothetical protein [Betaproteobacteria bacterium]
MRFLIVDASREHRQMLAAMLHARWPSAHTDEWDPREQGEPRTALARGRYDAILLEWQPEPAGGFERLAELRREAGVVPIVLITAQGGNEPAQQASKLAAMRVLRRSELTLARLLHALEPLLRAREGDVSGMPAAASPPVRARSVGSASPANTPVIPGYRILGIIGQGGMARVYLAEREADGLRLVLKVLDPALRADVTYVKRLEREYRLIASIRNEHVARVYDQDFTGEHPYIAME